MLSSVAVASLGGCRRAPDPERVGAGAAALGGATLAVGRAAGPIEIDGEIEEASWTATARSGAFVDGAGGEARPFSEARFLWDEKNLYLTLYAADDDIRARVTAHDGPVWIDDHFSLRLVPPSGATFSIDVSPTGVTMDAQRGRDGKQDASWESGIRVAVDRDGSLNDPSDEDEEWVVEAAIPWSSLGVIPAAGTRIGVEITRCDTPRNTRDRRCGSYGTAKDRRTLVLSAGRAE
jgi:hypothetical protein